jgi:nucleoside-diphosphate-sugar epimerase
VSEILVTGGNGFVGRHLVAALTSRGDQVRVLALTTDDTTWLQRHGVAVYRGDICSPTTITPAVHGVDAVLHLAAMSDIWRPLSEYRAVNVAGTVNVCRAALTAGVTRLVHMSSSSVYGCGTRQPADESFPLRPFRDPYPMSKAEADLAVQRMIAGEGLPAVIVRPDQIFGPGDRLHFGRMADRLRSGIGVVIGSGNNRLPLVYVDDLVAGLLLALDHPAAAGRVYNITNDGPLTQLELLTSIAAEIGARPPRWHVPYSVLYAAGGAAERMARLRGGSARPPVTRFGVAFYGSDWRNSIARIRRELGCTPMVPLREAVRRTASWYLQDHLPRAAEQVLPSDLGKARV